MTSKLCIRLFKGFRSLLQNSFQVIGKKVFKLQYDRRMHYVYDSWFDFAVITRYQNHVMNWLNKVHLQYQSAIMSQIRATVDRLLVTQRKDKSYLSS